MNMTHFTYSQKAYRRLADVMLQPVEQLLVGESRHVRIIKVTIQPVMAYFCLEPMECGSHGPGLDTSWSGATKATLLLCALWSLVQMARGPPCVPQVHTAFTGASMVVTGVVWEDWEGEWAKSGEGRGGSEWQ